MLSSRHFGTVCKNQLAQTSVESRTWSSSRRMWLLPTCTLQNPFVVLLPPYLSHNAACKIIQ